MSISIEYLAGIFDGEGSFSINRMKLPKSVNWRHTARVSFGMTNPRIVKEFHRLFGGYYACKVNPTGRLLMYNWQICGNLKTKAFIEMFMPYLIVKKPQAKHLYKFCCEFQAAYSRKKQVSQDELQWRESMYQQLKALNRGYAPATTERDDAAMRSDSLNSQATERGESEAVLPPLQ